MTCYFPLQAFKGRGEDPSKTVIVFKRSDSFRGERLDLPCGQCIGCRLERSRQWAVRCLHEASLYERNSFVTLTYDDAHLPVGDELCRRCVGSHVIGGSVCVADFQDFMKRLRKEAGSGVRFFHCGEYGEKLGRPHYHALLFNHDFDDKVFFSGKDEKVVYTSDSLSGLWPQGFSVVGKVTFDSASYVARYCLKKVTGVSALEHYLGRKPEYTTMSRRPGIGKGWLDKFSGDVYPLDRVVVRGKVTRPPRFYDTQFAKVDPSCVALLKIQRAENEHFVTDTLTDGRVVVESDSSARRLAVKDEVKRAEISRLVRSLE